MEGRRKGRRTNASIVFNGLLGHVVSAKIFQEIIANDVVDILEAFASSSLLVLDGGWRKVSGRRYGGGCNGGHVE